MKLPALWLAAAFASGIALSSAWTRPGLAVWLSVATLSIFAGSLLIWRGRVVPAWIASLAAWISLGSFAVAVERASVPENLVTRLISSGRLDTSDPLLWRGRLQEDPTAFPWGRRLQIALESATTSGQPIQVRGGLRLNYYFDEKNSASVLASLDSLRAGDRVEVLAKAHPVRNYQDPGVFDFRAYLARQGVDVIGTLRSPDQLQWIARPPPTLADRIAHLRGIFLHRVDSLFAGDSGRAAVLRAMLLGDRSFVDSSVVINFQKTGAYHVLVVAGLHVGALAIFVFWLCRRLRLSALWTSIASLAILGAYVCIVQDRPPIFRAALIAALYICGRPLFRRVELLNTLAVAAIVLLLARPSFLLDSSFELSFLAALVLAGLAIPWMDRTSVPYRAALRHLGDTTRDSAFSPRLMQFRVEMRGSAGWLAARLPQKLAPESSLIVSLPVRAGLRLWEVLLLSAVMQWGMLPVLAGDFHRITLAAPLSNVPAVLLTGLIVPLGFLTLAASFVWSGLAAPLAHALNALAGLLLASVNWFANWPRASYRIPGPPLWLVILFFAVFVGLAATARTALHSRRYSAKATTTPPRTRWSEWLAAGVLAVLTVVIATYPFAPRLPRGKLEVNVLDVGQGDSIFVAFPAGQTMLIDGGGTPGVPWASGPHSSFDIGEEVVSPYLWSRGLKRIDVVTLTHAHHDHIDGLFSVLQNFSVGELWIGRYEDTPALRRLLAEARARHVRVLQKEQGDTFNWPPAKGEILWPEDESQTAEVSNDDSVVMRLEDGAFRFLLPGDAQKKSEEAMVAAHEPLAADFLKVPHHGSKTSSTEDFLEAVRPKVAVVSAGAGNPFGHPAEETVERYERDGIRLLRTDRDGEITASTDGVHLNVHTFAPANEEAN
ncbi:MAG TPA: ComEC/Rec2 family competence protein [Candidatus Acidoferrum sp.]|nr:ComEC/Rec2 family competence protein [Candidatus Acidoferrum sp.]